jgi:DNA-binding MarR family transcriptional regulator
MANREKIIEEAANRFNRVIRKFKIAGRVPKDHGTGELLFSSEIHTIVAISENQKINITELAKKLGVTKGTISQLVSKLEGKGYLKRVKGVKNQKEVLLEVTKKGLKAKVGHDHFHDELNKSFLKGITKEQFVSFNDVLKNIEAFVDNIIKNQ